MTPETGPRGARQGPTPLILDCDPGHDDALAIIVALARPELELLAVTTVAGNAGLDATTRNRTDGALVRVSTPIVGSEDEAFRHAVAFVGEAFPALGEYLPG